MTTSTTSADQQVPAGDFPITWDDPLDAEFPWFQDVMHNPLPITPLTATLFQPAFAEGAGRAIGRLSMPVEGLNVTIQNGYVYLGPRPVLGSPDEMEARFAEMQRLTIELTSTVLKDWRETFEPMVLAKCDRVFAFDYDNASTRETAQFVRTLRDELVDAWDIHMRVNIPPMNAVFGFEEMLGGALGQEAVQQSRLLLQGFDNKSVQLGRTLWSLSRWIRGIDGLTEAIAAARVRDGAVDIGDHGQSGAFQERWQEFLDTYGWRSDRFMEFGHKSWREDPSTPLTQLKGYLRIDDAQDPFAGHGRFVSEHEAIAAKIEGQLPPELRPVFRMMLPLAQQYIPIAEDHNFTIDQKFTMVVRSAILRLGHKLAAEGALRDPESIFYLTFDEICDIADGTTPDGLDERVRQRQRELGRQASMKAPTMIGTPPPADVPPDPVVTKFFGVGLVPSSDASVITGHPCSTGVVTGEAKIVLTLDEAGKVNPGDVLVCRMTMPAWTPLFGVVAAVVADSGGPLSHCAIVAREYMIPCVAGTVNGTAVLRDGMRVRVDGGTGIVTVLDERRRG
ncbi:MAG: PEP-utilizing enzyme [Dehalococcoidia bacterium]